MFGESLSCDLAVAIPTPPRTAPHTHFIVSVARGPEVYKVRSITELCGLRVSVDLDLAPKGPLQCRRCQRFGHTQRSCGYAPRCVACGGSQLSGGCSTPWDQPAFCDCGGNHTASYRGCVKWKEAMAALAKQAPQRSRESVATAQPTAPKAQRAGRSAEQKCLGDGWNHVIQGGISPRLSHATNHTLIPSSSGKEGALKPIVTDTRETARPKNLNRNTQQPLNGLLGTPVSAGDCRS